MRTLQILMLFLMMIVVMLGLSIPLWWKYAQPVIFALPDYINNVFRIINSYMDIFNKILKQI